MFTVLVHQHFLRQLVHWIRQPQREMQERHPPYDHHHFISWMVQRMRPMPLIWANNKIENGCFHSLPSVWPAESRNRTEEDKNFESSHNRRQNLHYQSTLIIDAFLYWSPSVHPVRLTRKRNFGYIYETLSILCMVYHFDSEFK